MKSIDRIFRGILLVRSTRRYPGKQASAVTSNSFSISVSEFARFSGAPRKQKDRRKEILVAAHKRFRLQKARILAKLGRRMASGMRMDAIEIVIYTLLVMW